MLCGPGRTIDPSLSTDLQAGRSCVVFKSFELLRQSVNLTWCGSGSDILNPDSGAVNTWMCIFMRWHKFCVCEHNNNLWDGAYVILHLIFSSQVLFTLDLYNFLLLLHWLFLLLLTLLPPLLPAPDQSLTQEKQRQMFQEHTTALSPTPQHLPFVLDQQLTPGKNWPYKHTHTHTHTKSTAAQIFTSSTVVQLKEQHIHTHTHRLQSKSPQCAW